MSITNTPSSAQSGSMEETALPDLSTRPILAAAITTVPSTTLHSELTLPRPWRGNSHIYHVPCFTNMISRMSGVLECAECRSEIFSVEKNSEIMREHVAMRRERVAAFSHDDLIRIVPNSETMQERVQRAHARAANRTMGVDPSGTDEMEALPVMSPLEAASTLSHNLFHHLPSRYSIDELGEEGYLRLNFYHVRMLDILTRVHNLVCPPGSTNGDIIVIDLGAVEDIGLRVMVLYDMLTDFMDQVEELRGIPRPWDFFPSFREFVSGRPVQHFNVVIARGDPVFPTIPLTNPSNSTRPSPIRSTRTNEIADAGLVSLPPNYAYPERNGGLENYINDACGIIVLLAEQSINFMERYETANIEICARLLVTIESLMTTLFADGQYSQLLGARLTPEERRESDRRVGREARRIYLTLRQIFEDANRPGLNRIPPPPSFPDWLSYLSTGPVDRLPTWVLERLRAEGQLD
ncbi:hypothetical protein NA57DRAFT_61533 [Rhizodiscina lignyota]|uniref:Uncharacterized protein n=1 Tax=Rhizodiscina lignyota TaxID=1504668 RepID=A0A9P4M1G1_9PEZI|nr:hypothetical protein NA57DRAFT_61533 [Rhizodiscina lignyota]